MAIQCAYEFDGTYSDPNHPNCTRTISARTADKAVVTGTDGANGGACDGTTDVQWGPLDAKVNGETIVIDFSPKGGPKDLTGTLSEDSKRINWADGNFWPHLRGKEF